MAWLMKNSGGTVIDRRDEPYLEEAMKKDLEKEVLTRFPTKQAATLPVLHAVQDKVGWLPYQAIEEIAEFLELQPSVVLDTATFYDQYFLEPQGKYVIWLCQSISCELLGQIPLRDAIAAKLGIGPGETTDDGKITLMDVECLGSCGTAPCALVNQKLHEDLTFENFEKVIDGLE